MLTKISFSSEDRLRRSPKKRREEKREVQRPKKVGGWNFEPSKLNVFPQNHSLKEGSIHPKRGESITVK